MHHRVRASVCLTAALRPCSVRVDREAQPLRKEQARDLSAVMPDGRLCEGWLTDRAHAGVGSSAAKLRRTLLCACATARLLPSGAL